MSQHLYRDRIDKDVGIRSYYSKFIFNSHFLIFIVIAGGVFLYTLLDFVSTAAPKVWLNVIPSILISLAVFTKYRSLLKRADEVFLPPYETHMKAYFNRVSSYSLIIGIPKIIIVFVVASILYSAGNDLLTLASLLVYTAAAYITAFNIRRDALNSPLSLSLLNTVLFVLNFVALMLITVTPYMIFAGLLALFLMKKYVNQRMYEIINWPDVIQFEAEQVTRYYRNVSMFTNVKHIDKQFKRRRYLDRLLWHPKENKYDKAHMYEYLFYRSFLRNHDLPMITLRLILIFGAAMIWMNTLYFSIIIVLFCTYLIVLQMSQIYTAQAYLLWPKVWPVNRSFIQKSYVTYSHKLVFVITLILSALFIVTHPGHFYIAVIFPVFGYIINRVLSQSVYKKERLLSD